MGRKSEEAIRNFTHKYSQICVDNNAINPELFSEYGVKRGLRDKNGKGVLSGLTNISMIKSSEEIDGKSVPCDGELYYRGYNIFDLVRGFQADGRFGFDECAYLLLFGDLPTADQLMDFKKTLAYSMTLPTNFVRDVIMKAPSHDIMNSLTKSVLTLASYDDNVSDLSLDNVLRQSLMLISVFPMLSVYGYHAYNHYECDDSLYIHRPDPTLSTAENLLRMLRPDKSYTPTEAKVLDAALVLHMEHGGGNNSTFTTRVVTSSGSDTYSVIAAALSSLKGPKHGGANIKVVQMMEDLRRNVEDTTDEDAVRAYLYRLLNKEAFDKSGLIYGMGHAVYTLSDPREVILKDYAQKLAESKGMLKEYSLYDRVERIGTQLLSHRNHVVKPICANVDFYSGFIYTMLGIPEELFTPIFAISRIAGWSAHRLEELVNRGKIIRPAYKYVGHHRPFVDAKDRGTTEE